MLKFNTDQFLAHFFKKDERVDVNADELQRLVRESRSKDAEIKRLCKIIAEQKMLLLTKDDKILSLEAKIEPTYRLDLSA